MTLANRPRAPRPREKSRAHQLPKRQFPALRSEALPVRRKAHIEAKEGRGEATRPVRSSPADRSPAFLDAKAGGSLAFA